MNQPVGAVDNEAPLAWLAYLIAVSSALSMLMGMALLVAFFGPLAWLVVLAIQTSVNAEPAKAHTRRARRAIGAHILLSVLAFGISAVLLFSMAGLSLESVMTAIDIIELEGIKIVFMGPFWGTLFNDYMSDPSRSGFGLFLAVFGAPVLGTLIGCVVGLVSLIRLIPAMQELGNGKSR